MAAASKDRDDYPRSLGRTGTDHAGDTDVVVVDRAAGRAVAGSATVELLHPQAHALRAAEEIVRDAVGQVARLADVDQHAAAAADDVAVDVVELRVVDDQIGQTRRALYSQVEHVTTGAREAAVVDGDARRARSGHLDGDALVAGCDRVGVDSDVVERDPVQHGTIVDHPDVVLERTLDGRIG